MADRQSDDRRARALSALARGETAAAIADLRAYVEVEPDDDGAWLSLGTAFAAIGHGPEAVSALARAVELDGSVVDARLAYARALRAVGKLDDAAFQLLQAARLFSSAVPEDARVLRELGIVFYDKHLYDKAVTWLERAAAAAPEDGRASYALGLAHEARKDPGAAVAAYREALRRQPDLVDARRTLADLYATMGEHERAVEQLEALLARERSDEQAAHNRDVLLRALAEMNARRLLGKTEHELELSALVQEGHLVKKERIEPAGADEEVWTRLAPTRRCGAGRRRSPSSASRLPCPHAPSARCTWCSPTPTARRGGTTTCSRSPWSPRTGARWPRTTPPRCHSPSCARRSAAR
jgi:tetratricopeptide (TPR) repeat protein